MSTHVHTTLTLVAYIICTSVHKPKALLTVEWRGMCRYFEKTQLSNPIGQSKLLLSVQRTSVTQLQAVVYMYMDSLSPVLSDKTKNAYNIPSSANETATGMHRCLRRTSSLMHISGSLLKLAHNFCRERMSVFVTIMTDRSLQWAKLICLAFCSSVKRLVKKVIWHIRLPRNCSTKGFFYHWSVSWFILYIWAFTLCAKRLRSWSTSPKYSRDFAWDKWY